MRKIRTLDLPSIEKGRIRSKCVNTFLYSYEASDQLFDELRNKHYFIRTYGCQANIRDEETLVFKQP